MEKNTKIRRGRGLRSALLTIALALPLVAAKGCDITGLGDEEDTSASYDGTYDLVQVDNKSLPMKMIDIDSQNYLMLTKGTWTLTGGKTLNTEMYTYSVINGVRKTDPSFNPEKHYGTVTISSDRATGTLETQSSVYATFSGGTLLTTQNGRTMKFVKR